MRVNVRKNMAVVVANKKSSPLPARHNSGTLQHDQEDSLRRDDRSA